MKRAFFLFGCFAGFSSVFADEFFTSKIEPLLKQRCFECHSHEKKMKGGLTLDSKSGWEQGGDSGPTLVAGKPEESLLIKMVRWSDDEHQMPPKEKLPSAEIAMLEEWVKRGAPDPRDGEETAHGVGLVVVEAASGAEDAGDRGRAASGGSFHPGTPGGTEDHTFTRGGSAHVDPACDV